MSTRFEQSLAFILEVEAGFVIDNGGPTNHGITQVAYDEYRTGLEPRPVQEITAAEVQSIYLQDFWSPINAAKLPAGLDLAMFDAAVQHGPGTASRLLQRLLHVKRDGHIGPKTLEAVAARPVAILSAELQVARVQRIYTRHPKWAEYGKGWTDRLARLNLEVLRQV